MLFLFTNIINGRPSAGHIAYVSLLTMHKVAEKKVFLSVPVNNISIIDYVIRIKMVTGRDDETKTKY